MIPAYRIDKRHLAHTLGRTNTIAKAQPMTPEQECWAEALAVERLHGEGAPKHIAERIGALALAGDMKGVERWKEIAARLDELRRSMSRPAS